uniref:Lipoprotein n=1 Tax=viral metagenome TaxID=1070528 RepID=A0A6H2A1D2_9ZZZZ
MRKLIIAVLLSLMLAGCLAQKIVIPDEPKYMEIQVYQFEQGTLFDPPGMAALQYNIQALKDYADQLRSILEEQNK